MSSPALLAQRRAQRVTAPAVNALSADALQRLAGGLPSPFDGVSRQASAPAPPMPSRPPGSNGHPAGPPPPPPSSPGVPGAPGYAIAPYGGTPVIAQGFQTWGQPVEASVGMQTFHRERETQYMHGVEQGWAQARHEVELRQWAQDRVAAAEARTATITTREIIGFALLALTIVVPVIAVFVELRASRPEPKRKRVRYIYDDEDVYADE